jgi:hypothetical protein
MRLLGLISDDFHHPKHLPGGRWMIGTQNSQTELKVYSFDVGSHEHEDGCGAIPP